MGENELLNQLLKLYANLGKLQIEVLELVDAVTDPENELVIRKKEDNGQ